MGKIKCLIIQPHSDDAVLCCSKFLFDDEYDVKVLTIENNPKRLKEDEELFSFVGIRYTFLKNGVMDDYYPEFFQVYGKNAVLSDENVIPFYKEKLGKRGFRALLTAIQEKVIYFLNRGYVIVCPMGVGHPFHYLVRYSLRKYEGDFIFYREFPHSYKKKAKEQFTSETENLSLLFDYTDEEASEIKYQLAQKFYKSQSGFFFYEKGNIDKHYPEEFYVYSEEEEEDDERHIRIYVISKDRPKGKTFDILNRGGVEYTAVIEPQDENQYRQAGHKNVLVLPENDRGFSYTVNYSKNQYDGKNPVVIMDDDIMNLYYSVPGIEKISPSLKTGEEIKEWFDKLNEQILNTEFDIGTIGKSAFDWSCRDVSPRIACDGSKIKYSGLPVVIIINNPKLLKFDLDENLCFKSDIDYALKCMYLGFRYAKFVYFLQQTKMNKDAKQKGGLVETYKKSEKLIKAQDILLKRWPDNISIDLKKKPTNGVPELKIMYVKSENEPNIINEIRKKL